ncbi:MAG: transglutaminase domain-containing protein, partial [Ferruginibacter sp.]
LKFIPIFLFYLLFSYTAYCQNKFEKIDFSEVDKFAKSVKYKDDIFNLTHTLTTPYNTDILKVRAIFIWITDNIEYDYKMYNEGTQQNFSCTGKKDVCETAKIAFENDFITTVLNKQKGICSGYARLFKKMCEIANIKSETVSGYTKKSAHQIGISLSVSHDWNAVQIDSSYYFLDATWAAGYCPINDETGKLKDYTKRYNNYYWLTPFYKLAQNHFPTNEKWIPEKKYNKEWFFNSPYYAQHAIEKIILTNPTTGMLNKNKNDTIHFEFNYTDKINTILINTNNYQNPTLPLYKTSNGEIKVRSNDSLLLKRIRYIPFIQKGNTYTFDYIVTEQTLSFLEILLDYRVAMKFKIKVN